MSVFEDHEQWPTVKEICEKIIAAGHQAFLAGGCVRDHLLNVRPKDFDIATSARPDEVQALFPKSLDIGKEFGVIILPFDGFQVEVTTFRKDNNYKDGRHPQNIEFSEAKEDAQRRDFTINALFYDIQQNEIIDYVHGKEDLKKRYLRAVGLPQERFEEDQLRILRAIRFSAQLNFEIEPETLKAIEACAPKIHSVAKERVREELFKMLRAPFRQRGIKLFIEVGLFNELFSHFNEEGRFYEKSWYDFFQNLPSLGRISESLLVSFLMLPWVSSFDNTGEVVDGEWILDEVLQKKIQESLAPLKLSRDTVKRTQNLLSYWLAWAKTNQLNKGYWLNILGSDQERALIQLVKLSQPLRQTSDLEEWEEKVLETQGTCNKWPKALLSGKDFQGVNSPSGPKLGKLLKRAYYLQLEHQIRDKDELLKLLGQVSIITIDN